MKVRKPSVSSGSLQRQFTTAKGCVKRTDGALAIDSRNCLTDGKPIASGALQPLGKQAVKPAMAMRQSVDVNLCILNSHAAANDQSFYSPKLAIDSEAQWNDIWQSHVLYPADLEKVICTLEGTWQRMAMHKAMHVAVLGDAVTGQNLLLLRVDVDALDSDGHALLEEVSHIAKYFWSQSDGKGSFATDVRWIGSTLLIELTSLREMRRWPRGNALVLTVQALLHHIIQLGGACTRSGKRWIATGQGRIRTAVRPQC